MKHKHRKPKHIPYGQKRTKQWCSACDMFYGPPEPNKKSERIKSKEIIKGVLNGNFD